MMDIKSGNFEQPSNNQFIQESEIVEDEDEDIKNRNNENNNVVYSKPPTPIKTPILIKQYNDQRLYDKFRKKQNLKHPQIRHENF
jgi:hypothetical protein